MERLRRLEKRERRAAVFCAAEPVSAWSSYTLRKRPAAMSTERPKATGLTATACGKFSDVGRCRWPHLGCECLRHCLRERSHPHPIPLHFSAADHYFVITHPELKTKPARGVKMKPAPPSSRQQEPSRRRTSVRPVRVRSSQMDRLQMFRMRYKARSAARLEIRLRKVPHMWSRAPRCSRVERLQVFRMRHKARRAAPLEIRLRKVPHLWSHAPRCSSVDRLQVFRMRHKARPAARLEIGLRKVPHMWSRAPRCSPVARLQVPILRKGTRRSARLGGQLREVFQMWNCATQFSSVERQLMLQVRTQSHRQHRTRWWRSFSPVRKRTPRAGSEGSGTSA